MKPSIDYGREDIVKFLYLEEVLAQKSVLIIGPENENLMYIFEKMGCRSVKMFMPGKETLPDFDLAFLRGKRDATEERRRLIPFGAGQFDIIFIPDIGSVQDYRMVLSECSRIAGAKGLVVITARNAECTIAISQTGLEETADIWSLQSLEEMAGGYFKFIEKVGQCPFLAYAMVSFDPRRAEEGVRLDTSLMGSMSEEPEFFLLLCSNNPYEFSISNAVYQIPIVEMAPVQMPVSELPNQEEIEPRAIKTENEMLKKEISEKNVLVARLKKEIERLEREAEERRQKMFEMKQKMEQQRKDVQKEVLEKAIQKQVEKIPETWLGERESLMKEMEKLRKDYEKILKEDEVLRNENSLLRGDKEANEKRLNALKEEIEKLKEENIKIKAERDKEKDKVEDDKLKKELKYKEQIIEELLHELEIAPIGELEEGEKNKEVEEILHKVKEFETELSKSKDELDRTLKLKSELERRIEELVALNQMLADMIKLKENDYEKEKLFRIESVLNFCQDEIKKLAERIRVEGVGRELAILWARVEERKRLV